MNRLFTEAIEDNAIPEGFVKEYTFDEILADIKFINDFNLMSDFIEERHICNEINKKANNIMISMTRCN